MFSFLLLNLFTSNSFDVFVYGGLFTIVIHNHTLPFTVLETGRGINLNIVELLYFWHFYFIAAFNSNLITCIKMHISFKRNWCYSHASKILLLSLQTYRISVWYSPHHYRERKHFKPGLLKESQMDILLKLTSMESLFAEYCSLAGKTITIRLFLLVVGKSIVFFCSF